MQPDELVPASGRRWAAAEPASLFVTNSVNHGGASPEEGVLVRTQLTGITLPLEVEDPGQRGGVAPRPLGESSCDGFGLNVVQQLSRRAGVERAGDIGTRVWVDLAQGA